MDGNDMNNFAEGAQNVKWYIFPNVTEDKTNGKGVCYFNYNNFVFRFKHTELALSNKITGKGFIPIGASELNTRGFKYKKPIKPRMDVD